MITNRDPKFISEFQRTIFKRIGIKLLRSTSYYPQTDRQLERTNQTVEIAIRYQIARYPDRVLEQRYALPQIQFILNNSENASIGIAPNILLFGFKPREVPNCTLEGPLKDREVLKGEAEDVLAFANIKIKKRYDAVYKPQIPEASDIVMLNLKYYYVPGVTNRKLSDRRVGPFRIKYIQGKLVCKLALSKYQKIYLVILIADLEP